MFRRILRGLNTPQNSPHAELFWFLLALPIGMFLFVAAIGSVMAFVWGVFHYPWILLLAYPMGVLYCGFKSKWGKE